MVKKTQRKLSKHKKRIKKVAVVYKKYHQKVKNFFTSFTIVELLVVIAVIGILATIVSTTYSGVQKRAIVASIRSELSDLSKQLEMFHAINDKYPDTLDCDSPESDTNTCIKPSNNAVIYDYLSSNSTNPIFCITVDKNDYSYNVNQNGDVLAGPCPILNLSASNSVSYNGVGNTWYDISGNDNDSTVHGPKYSMENGGILTFDGVDDYVSSAYIDETDSNQITVTAWIRPGSTNGIYEISNQGEWSTGPWVGWRFRQIGKELDFSLSDGTDDVYECAGGGLTADAWQYVIGMWDGEYIRIYVNGQEVASCEEAVDYSNNKGEHSIGKFDGSSYFFNGMIGSISVNDKALSPAEILENFDITKVLYN